MGGELELHNEIVRKCKVQLAESTTDIEKAIAMLHLYHGNQNREASDAMLGSQAAQDAADRENAELRKKVKELSDALSTAQIDHRNQVQGLEDELEKLKAELNGLKGRNQDAAQAGADSNDRLKKELELANSRLDEAKDNISAKQDEVDALQAKLDKAHEHGYESGDEIDPRRVQADLERALATIAELEDEVERLKARIAELEARIKQLEAENAALAEKNADLMKKLAECHEECARRAAQPAPAPVPEPEPEPEPVVVVPRKPTVPGFDEASAWDQYLDSRSPLLKTARVDIARWLNIILERKEFFNADNVLRHLALGEVLGDLAVAITAAETAYRATEKGQKADKVARIKAQKAAKAAAAGKAAPSKQKSRASAGKVGAKAGGKAKKIKSYVPEDATLNLQVLIQKRGLTNMEYTRDVAPGSPEARANVQAFLEWAVGLGGHNPELWAINDLCKYENEMQVLCGMFDVARRSRSCPVPMHIAFERARYRLHPEQFADHLEQRVWEVAENQICGLEFIRPESSEGKYTILDATSNETHTIKMREVGKNITVRTGGGYLTLKEWIALHDPWETIPEFAAAVKVYRKNHEQLHQDTTTGMPIRGTHPAIMTTRPEAGWLK